MEAVHGTAERRGFFGDLWGMLQQTYAEWSDDDAAELAASLSYYTLFSLAPILVLTIAIAGVVFGRDAVQGMVVHHIAGLVGIDAAKAIQDLIVKASRPSSGLLASLIGFVALLFGASGVVGQLKAALNRIWDVPAKSAGFFGAIRERLTTFALVLGIGFVLLVSLVINTGLVAFGTYATGALPGDERIWIVPNFIITVAVESVLFALMFKYLPDTEVHWSEVRAGALATALLFELGKTLLSAYLGWAGVGSAFGAAGSLIVVLVWVYYSAQILFFGAEFTQVFAQHRRGNGNAVVTKRE